MSSRAKANGSTRHRARLQAASALVLGIAVALSVPVIGTSTNFGAGITNPAFRCTNIGDTYEKESECITNDTTFLVWLDTAGLPNGMATAFANSVLEDYSLYGFAGGLQSSVNSYTDVKVIEAQIEGSYDYAIFTSCAANATEGGGNGEYRWCKPAVIVFDNTHHNTAHVKNNKEWFACHELGHTAGLAHYTVGVNRSTCMDYTDKNQPNLHAHDEEHLQDCYPLPAGPPLTLTAACAVQGVH